MLRPSRPSFSPPAALWQRLTGWLLIWGMFGLGLAWLVVRPMGLHFTVIPGVYGDTRLISFILEHVYRWVCGLEASLWNTQAFYPYPLTLAFSDNLLGVAPFYIPLRLAGLGRESALQGWILLGFLVNYAACVFVLARLRFHPAAAAVGAFFFAFGLPMLANESRLQLLYRAGVPLAGYALWRFAQTGRLGYLVGLALAAVYQIYCGIYTGVLLCWLLAALALMIPLFHPERVGRWGWARFWPERLRLAWSQAGPPARLGALVGLGLAMAALVGLFWPYRAVQQLYGFQREWASVVDLLPRLQSYFVADQLSYWQPVSNQLWGMPTMRNEHQLFVGWGVLALVGIGLLAALRWNRRRFLALAHVAAVGVLVLLTLNIGGFSLYRFMYALPGMDSIRFVTRVQLVLMWPLALLAACAAEWLVGRARGRLLTVATALVVLGLVFVEPALWKNNLQFVKQHAIRRLEDLRTQLPQDLPADPILFLAVQADESFVISETDGMLLAQDLGWPTFNGYFGNFPPGYQPAESCRELPARIVNFLQFDQRLDETAYLALMARAVPVGFSDCDPAWWQRMPALESSP